MTDDSQTLTRMLTHCVGKARIQSRVVLIFPWARDMKKLGNPNEEFWSTPYGGRSTPEKTGEFKVI